MIPLGQRLLAILLLVLLTGCWNRREVNEVAITTAVAIDLEEGRGIRVTAQILHPTPGGAQESDAPAPRTGSFAVTATGQTVFDALRNLNQVISRRPEWKHNNAIILGEAVARQGIGDILDFFVRDHESRLDQWILVARGRAADVLVPRFRLEGNQGAGIRRLNQNAYRATAKTVQIRLRDFLITLSSPPASPVAAVIDLTSVAGEPSALSETGERLRVRSAAIFRGERLAGWLNGQEVRGMQWFTGKVASTIFVMPCQKGTGRGIGVEVMSGRAKMQPVAQAGRLPWIRVSVRVTAKLGDVMCPEDLSKPDALHALEARTGNEIEAEMGRVMHRLQHELVLDPVGIANALERAYPVAWKSWKTNWSEIYPQLRIVPAVQVKLEQTGTASGKPLGKGD